MFSRPKRPRRFWGEMREGDMDYKGASVSFQHGGLGKYACDQWRVGTLESGSERGSATRRKEAVQDTEGGLLRSSLC